MKPYGSLVLIQPDHRRTSSDTGILFIKEEIKRTEYGTIKDIGKDVTTVKEGEKVLYPLGAAQHIEYQGVIYILIREKDIMAIKP